jgi:hypothetical protein
LLADGEDAWSWRLDAGVKSVELAPPATEATKPDLRGERGISRKPLRAGMPGDSGATAVNTRVHLSLPSAHEAAGALGTRYPPRPLYSWANDCCKNSGAARRENAELYSNVIASSTCDEAIHPYAVPEDCFACARNNEL